MGRSRNQPSWTIMATTARHVCRTLFQVSRQIPVKRKCPPQLLVRHRQATSFRPLSTTISRQADTPRNRQTDDSVEDESDEIDPSEYLSPRRTCRLRHALQGQAGIIPRPTESLRRSVGVS